MTLIKNQVITVDDVECEVIRENDRTYSVSTEMGTGLVSKEPLSFVGDLKRTHESRYGRSFTGVVTRVRK